MRLLKHIINSDRRAYFIEEVNEPLVGSIIKLATKYPEPISENVVHPNTQVLLDLEEKFFKCWKTTPRGILYKTVFRLLQTKIEHSATYREMFNWLIYEINKDKRWKHFDSVRQMNCWREDNVSKKSNSS